MDGRFAEIEKDIAIIKTVLIMKNIMPVEIARGGE
jgi:ribosomal protein L29